jgi:hypothetical protein
MIAILIGVTWNLSVALVCITLITKDVKHFFHVFHGHLLFFFEKCSVAHLLIELFDLWIYIFLNSSYILDLIFWYLIYIPWILVSYQMNSCQSFFVVLGFKFRASHFLGRCSATWATLPVCWQRFYLILYLSLHFINCFLCWGRSFLILFNTIY